MSLCDNFSFKSEKHKAFYVKRYFLYVAFVSWRPFSGFKKQSLSPNLNALNFVSWLQSAYCYSKLDKKILVQFVQFRTNFSLS